MSTGESTASFELNRRGFLNLAGIAGAVVGANLLVIGEASPLYQQEVGEMLTAADSLPLPVKASLDLPQQEQMFVESNPRLKAVGHAATHAYVVVHPGYLMTQVGDMVEQYGDLHTSLASSQASVYSYDTSEKDRQDSDRWDLANFTGLLRGSEGDYQAYHDHMADLFEHLRQTEAPVIVFAEERAAYTGNRQYPELAIPDNALVMVTQKADPAPVDSVLYQGKNQVVREDQNPELLYEWLEASGITQVHAAGELGLSRGGGIFPACLGGVVELLQERDFTVHGIEGAVFPSAPVDLHNRAERKGNGDNVRMADALYADTVPLP
jgi:hypothetical protein